MLSPGTFGHGGAYGTQAWIDPTKKRIYLLMVQRSDFPNSDASDVRPRSRRRRPPRWTAQIETSAIRVFRLEVARVIGDPFKPAPSIRIPPRLGADAQLGECSSEPAGPLLDRLLVTAEAGRLRTGTGWRAPIARKKIGWAAR